MATKTISYQDVSEKSEISGLIEIPVHCNGWITIQSADRKEVITDKGLGDWVSNRAVISVYFYVEKAFYFDLYIKCKVPNGMSMIQVTIGENSQVIHIEGDGYKWYRIGTFEKSDPGYVKLDLKGVEKSGKYFADVSHIGLQFNDRSITFIRDIDRDKIYWRRRGPFIHLWYEIPDNTDKYEYYYNEMTIPSGYDPIGSYFMAIGFKDGYFGLQVNGESERRVLFSVWSPQKTDDPKLLLEENKVRLVDKSPDVIHNVFGGEGCGGQSILKYMWSPDITYKFLVRGRPDPTDPGHTIYSAWFAEVDKNWTFIASFKRPKTYEYLSGFYSFLESFYPEHSWKTRKVRYANQWARSKEGKWIELTSATLTGGDKVRLDFDAGVEYIDPKTEVFYLQSCGFFDKSGQIGKKFTRSVSKNALKINLPANN